MKSYDGVVDSISFAGFDPISGIGYKIFETLEFYFIPDSRCTQDNLDLTPISL